MAKGVELDCTGCPKVHNFRKGEIPEYLREGCGICGSEFAVRWVDY